MKLKSFGCSFIFGTDLHDDGSNEDFGKASQHTYPALLSKKLKYDYECHARPGAGNLQLLQRLLDEISKKEPSLYVINWSWIDRFSYINETLKHNRNPLGWQTIMPMDTDEITEFYYRNIHSELRDKLTSLIFIKTAIDVLKQSDSSFIMTYIDGLIFDKKWHTTDGILDVQEQVLPYLSTFSGMTFLDWTKKQGFEISDRLHPLENAHAAAADLIYQNLDFYIKS